MSELIGATAGDASGETVGRVLDVGCTAFERTDDALGRLRVVDLLVGRRTAGAHLGYVEESHVGLGSSAGSPTGCTGTTKGCPGPPSPPSTGTNGS